VFRAGGTAAAELLAFLRLELPDWIPLLHEFIGKRVEANAHLEAVEFLLRVRRLESLALAARHRFAEVDVIASPTTPASPPRLDEVATWESYRACNLRMVRNTGTANLLGLNALTMPVALDALRLPVGLQLMAAPGRDDLLFAAALAFEQALGTSRQRLGLPPGAPVS
jgi:aspartyl-tRNA(Asn)/glutamyl-tRNA(Gln) amidotransferase subunit A